MMMATLYMACPWPSPPINGHKRSKVESSRWPSVYPPGSQPLRGPARLLLPLPEQVDIQHRKPPPSLKTRVTLFSLTSGDLGRGHQKSGSERLFRSFKKTSFKMSEVTLILTGVACWTTFFLPCPLPTVLLVPWSALNHLVSGLPSPLFSPCLL